MAAGQRNLVTWQDAGLWMGRLSSDWEPASEAGNRAMAACLRRGQVYYLGVVIEDGEPIPLHTVVSGLLSVRVTINGLSAEFERKVWHTGVGPGNIGFWQHEVTVRCTARVPDAWLDWDEFVADLVAHELPADANQRYWKS